MTAQRPPPCTYSWTGSTRFGSAQPDGQPTAKFVHCEPSWQRHPKFAPPRWAKSTTEISSTDCAPTSLTKK